MKYIVGFAVALAIAIPVFADWTQVTSIWSVNVNDQRYGDTYITPTGVKVFKFTDKDVNCYVDVTLASLNGYTNSSISCVK